MLMQPVVPFEPVSTQTVPEGPEWLAQIKWDGVRVLTYYDGQEVRLFNRRLNERTVHYPEVADIKSYTQASSLILDGEIIALGPGGRPSFQEVMRRDGLRIMAKVARAVKEVPITYMVFDILYLNGRWLNNEPLTARQEYLQQWIRAGEKVQLVDSHEEGTVLYQAVREYGLEGIVVKRQDSPYLIGGKSKAWYKIKNYQDIIAVIGGFTLNSGTVSSLLLGLYDQKGRLWYIGHSGTGKLTQQNWHDLTASLKPLIRQDSPFQNRVERERAAVWLQPRLTVKVQFAEWTKALSLRQPSIQAFVEVPPEECLLPEVNLS